jgi:very-short-patch-repair endonuclease
MALLSPEQLEMARRLRRQDVACERRLWGALRGRRLNGLKFVRQLPIGPFIVDFACREVRLVVEVDGATHSTDDEVAYDAARTAFIERQGWRVMRVWNDDVVGELDEVLESILRNCAAR